MMALQGDPMAEFLFWQRALAVLSVGIAVAGCAAMVVMALALSGIMKAHERIASALDTLAGNHAGARATSPRE